MFIFTTRLTRKKIAAGIGVLGIVLIAVILLASNRSQAETVAQGAPSTKNIKTQEQRIAYLADWGWKAVAETEEIQEVMIPETFDEVFEKYNQLQESQGFNLEKYKGKRVVRYIYELTEYPSDTCVFATVLVYKNTIIGGDIQCPKLDGFMHGFNQVTSNN